MKNRNGFPWRHASLRIITLVLAAALALAVALTVRHAAAPAPARSCPHGGWLVPDVTRTPGDQWVCGR